MNIGVLVLVEIPKRLEITARGFCESCSAIEINQRMTVRLLAQEWEIFAKEQANQRGLVASLCTPQSATRAAYAPVLFKTRLSHSSSGLFLQGVS